MFGVVRLADVPYGFILAILSIRDVLEFICRVVCCVMAVGGRGRGLHFFAFPASVRIAGESLHCVECTCELFFTVLPLVLFLPF